MYVYMGHMKAVQMEPYEPWFWEKNRIELKQARVRKVDTADKTIRTDMGEEIAYDVLVLATGSKPNTLNIPGEKLKGVQGFYSMQDLELLEKNTHPPLIPKAQQKVKSAVIVGGGLIAIELAEMLLTRNIQVTIVERGPHYWSSVLPAEDSAFLTKHIIHHGAQLMTETQISEILGDEDYRVRAVVTHTGETVSCELVCMAIGVRPNMDFLFDADLRVDHGILVNHTLQTSVLDVYAAGDCAQFDTPPSGRKSIEQTWYTGRMMGECLGATLSGTPTPYRPGPWFNSAKFFDIEYQTYGMVSARPADDETHFWWQHPTEAKAIRLAWEKKTNIFKGINAYGIRIRHERADQWLRDGMHIYEVVKNLPLASFEPELTDRFEPAFVAAFNRRFGTDIQLSGSKRSGLFSFFRQKSK